MCAAALSVSGALLHAADGAGNAKKGRGPAASQWWKEIDTGPFIADTIMSADGKDVVALKGLAIKLGAARDVSVVFDTELLAWRGGFEGIIQLDGTPWSGSHGGNTHFPSGSDKFFFRNGAGLGWAVDGKWDDLRENKAGPLPREAGRYRGLFRSGDRTVLHLNVGGVKVLELAALEKVGDVRAITRTLNFAANPSAELETLVSEALGGESMKAGAKAYLVGAPSGVALKTTAEGRVTVTIAKGTPAARCKIVYAESELDAAALATVAAPMDLETLTHGGPALFPQTFAVKGQLDPDAATKTYAVDVIPLPAENPWKSPTRFGGFDFFPDGKRLAASTWNGDVWIADGIDGDLAKVTWRRYAAGMFQTLGLKIVDGVIYTMGRDQITRLRDLDGDGEADSYECFNNDVQITAGFHEFAFGLETDAAGNFYFSKAMPVLQGGRGFAPWTPHNGSVLKVSKDGATLERVAWGFRAPGGLGVSPEGVITTGENEGSWVPACKITWTPPGKETFNGVVPSKWVNRNEFGGTLPGAPTDYEKPLCWIPYSVDNSSGSQVWVPQNTAWDPRQAGEMLHLSYGKSSVFRVLREVVDGQVQGGVVRLPIDVSAAVMRARFHPQNGQLYVAGFRGWQTNGRDALQRVRYTGVTTAMPIGLEVKQNGVLVRFSAPLDPRTAEDPTRYSLSKWNYVWGPQYGSGRFSIDQRDAAAEERALTVPSKGAQNEIDTIQVGAAKLVEDGRAVFLYLPKLTTAMQMEVKLDLLDTKGRTVRETIYNTVHKFGPEYQVAGVKWADIKIADTTPSGEPGLAMSFDAEVTDTPRVDQIALTVPAGMSPSVFMPARPFGASWRGSLVVPERDELTFSFEGTGTVSLVIDGKPVMSGALPLTAKAPVTLAKGAHAIFASYRSPASGESRVRLMWSGAQFRTEPVPASAFRFIPGAEMEAWSKVRAGREVFTAAMCVKCHLPRAGGMPRDATPELAEMAPDFANLGQRLDRAWLERWIAAPQGRCPTIADTPVVDVVAYLSEQTDATWTPAAVPGEAATIAAGAALVEKLNLGFWVEPLTKARKHTDGGLVEFLAAPAKHHADTLFPDVRLSAAEAAQIAAYVRSKQPAARAAQGATGDAAKGAAFVAANCAACHGGKSTPEATLTSLDQLVVRTDWAVKGCVAENRGRAPDLHLTRDEVARLIAFRNGDRDVGASSLQRVAPTEYAERQMKRLNCTQCHAGGGENKIPDIAFAGEKLERAWLGDLLAGKHANRIRPWMEARMPAFASRAENLSRGLAAKYGVSLQSERPAMNPELVTTGAKLAGAEGYSCIACHDAGKQKALQVFEGQGPNLQAAGERLRYDYFQRWMHNPQRVQPATIMPRYTKDREKAALETQLDGVAEKQFEAVWNWIGTLKN